MEAPERWPVLVALLVAVGALAVGLVWLPYESRVTRASCERIKLGMTEAEVRAILGKPWDNSLLDPDEPGISGRTQILWTKQNTTVQPVNLRRWSADNLVLLVAFDLNRQVAIVQLQSEPDPVRSGLPT